ncbi:MULTISPECIES: CRISPR-associated endonuclease Cas3'' [unclassified Streptomyces]|uniref:CRISPR-associated endonuclease Cas3'' n=1 Tax=unclassified Streptomyces TaxID=2593676 RepID=UPI003D7390BE
MTSDSETLALVDPQLWGKQHGLPRAYPVVCHLLDTAAMAGALWDSLLSHEVVERLSGEVGVAADELRQLVCMWAGLHDLGKISPAFQRKCVDLYAALQAADPAYGPASAEELRDALTLRHDEATHWVLVGIFEEFGYPANPRGAHRGVGHQIAQMLGGHHGRFWPAMSRQQARRPRANHPGLGAGVWEEQCRAHAEAVRRMTESAVVPPRQLPASVAVVVAGLVIVADWLASQETFIVQRIPAPGWSADDKGLLAHWERSVKDAAAVVREAGLGRAVVRDLSFREMFGFEPNSLLCRRPW